MRFPCRAVAHARLASKPAHCMVGPNEVIVGYFCLPFDRRFPRCGNSDGSQREFLAIAPRCTVVRDWLCRDRLSQPLDHAGAILFNGRVFQRRSAAVCLEADGRLPEAYPILLHG